MSHTQRDIIDPNNRLYAVTIPLLLNAATVTGFSVIAAVVGGQSLSAVSDGDLSWNVGIAITCVVALILSFFGYRILHLYERWSWIPVLIAIVIAVGCGGNKLFMQAETAPPKASTILSYGCLIAGFIIPFGGTVSDVSVYISPEAPRYMPSNPGDSHSLLIIHRWKTFTYVYAGMAIPSILLLILGAAIGGAVPSVPEWSAAYDKNSVGGILAEMLAPAGGFGKFVVVILALSVIGNIAISMYSISLNIQMFAPFLKEVPRSIFSIITTAVLIPVSIKAAESFFDSLENFLGIISYWSASFVAVMIVEFVWFRKMDYSTYDHEVWNIGSKLPPGIAAISAGICSFALVVPSMAEVWYTGPIAKTTGDIGFEGAFVLSAILYVPFRSLEIKLTCGRV